MAGIGATSGSGAFITDIPNSRSGNNDVRLDMPSNYNNNDGDEDDLSEERSGGSSNAGILSTGIKWLFGS
jgi:hypothetical protein